MVKCIVFGGTSFSEMLSEYLEEYSGICVEAYTMHEAYMDNRDIKGKPVIPFEKIEEILGIKVGECTPDGKFSLDATRCIGACGLAPVMTINEDVYGKLTPEQIPDILAKY